MELAFWKLHGLGNDYLYFDVRTPGVSWPAWPEFAPVICDRHFGVGADGIILIAPSEKGQARMVIYNADGSRSEMCGNGLRGLAKWLFDRGQAPWRQVIETDAGLLYPEILETEGGQARLIYVNMGRPNFSAQAAHVDPQFSDELRQHPMKVAGETVYGTVVSMGNPHLIIFGKLWDAEKMARIGSILERHPWFLNRINVHSVEPVDPRHLKMRHWERGAGLTLACGTGAAAAAAAAIRQGLAESPVTIQVPGGQLLATWAGGPDDAVFLTGPAHEVFSGTYRWPR